MTRSCSGVSEQEPAAIISQNDDHNMSCIWSAHSRAHTHAHTCTCPNSTLCILSSSPSFLWRHSVIMKNTLEMKEFIIASNVYARKLRNLPLSSVFFDFHNFEWINCVPNMLFLIKMLLKIFLVSLFLHALFLALIIYRNECHNIYIHVYYTCICYTFL